MAYLVIAYPEIEKSDYELIQNYRRNNDRLFYSVVEPHFTIVFPVFDFPQKEFIAEIRTQANEMHEFEFSFRCATINKDAFSDWYHTFLVPDEGYSKIIKLHDRLYAKSLKENLRLDIDFIPHLGIGNSLDEQDCKRMVDEWNSKDFEINGRISSLTIISYEQDKVEYIDEVKLK